MTGSRQTLLAHICCACRYGTAAASCVSVSAFWNANVAHLVKLEFKMEHNRMPLGGGRAQTCVHDKSDRMGSV